MSPSIPAPPGYVAEYGEPTELRFANPNPANLFVVGLAAQGTVCQGVGVVDLRNKLGGRVNYSQVVDDTTAAIVEAGGATWTFSRVVGPSAVRAHVNLSDGTSTAITVTAKSPGDWANGATGGLKVQVTMPSSGHRQLIITLNGVQVASSPSTTLLTDLAAWSDANDYVDVAVVGTTLPVVVAATSLASGTDDRSSITSTEWAAAFAALDRRYGPGIMLLPGVTDETIIGLARTHGQTFNRVVLDSPATGASDSAVITAQQTLQADYPDAVKQGGTFHSWAYVTPVTGEQQRLVSWAAIQAGIQARVFQTLGVRSTAFGPARGPSRLAQKLYKTDASRSDDARAALYAAGVNVATDDGSTFSTWGYTTGDLDPLQQDLHHAFVRMAFRFDCEQVLKSKIGSYIDPATLSSLSGGLTAVAKRYQDDGAFIGTDADPGFRVDVDTVNTVDTGIARELNAYVLVRESSTADWVSLLITVTSPSATV